MKKLIITFPEYGSRMNFVQTCDAVLYQKEFQDWTHLQRQADNIFFSFGEKPEIDMPLLDFYRYCFRSDKNWGGHD